MTKTIFIVPALLLLAACDAQQPVDTVPADPNYVETPADRPCGGSNPREFSAENNCVEQ